MWHLSTIQVHRFTQKHPRTWARVDEMEEESTRWRRSRRVGGKDWKKSISILFVFVSHSSNPMDQIDLIFSHNGNWTNAKGICTNGGYCWKLLQLQMWHVCFNWHELKTINQHQNNNNKVCYDFNPFVVAVGQTGSGSHCLRSDFAISVWVVYVCVFVCVCVYVRSNTFYIAQQTSKGIHLAESVFFFWRRR